MVCLYFFAFNNVSELECVLGVWVVGGFFFLFCCCFVWWVFPCFVTLLFFKQSGFHSSNNLRNTNRLHVFLLETRPESFKQVRDECVLLFSIKDVLFADTAICGNSTRYYAVLEKVNFNQSLYLFGPTPNLAEVQAVFDGYKTSPVPRSPFTCYQRRETLSLFFPQFCENYCNLECRNLNGYPNVMIMSNTAITNREKGLVLIVVGSVGIGVGFLLMVFFLAVGQHRLDLHTESVENAVIFCCFHVLELNYE